MNLAPDWVLVLQSAGYEAVHWFTVGDPRAPDRDIMTWARTNGYVVFTHDLDFGSLLATTGAAGPSVIQVRTQDVTPAAQSRILLPALSQFKDLLEHGALITLEESRARARILPLS